MAVTTDNLLINVAVNTENAAKSMDELTKQFMDFKRSMSSVDKSSASTAKAMGGIGVSAIKLNAALEVARYAFEQVVKVAEATVGEWVALESANNRLANAMRVSGDYTRSSASDLQDYAYAVEQATTADEKQVLSMLSTAKAMGLTNDMAKKLVSTSIDVGVALGRNFDQVFKELSKTLSGDVARSLDNYVTDLKLLSEEQLMAGDAIDILNKRFKGFAESQNTTLGFALKSSSQAWGGLLDSIGKVISETFNLPEMFREISLVLVDLGNWIKSTEYYFNQMGTIILWVSDLLIDSLLFALKALYAPIQFVIAMTTLLGYGITKLGNIVGIFSDNTLEAWKRATLAQGKALENLADSASKSFKNIFNVGDEAWDRLSKGSVKATASMNALAAAAARISSNFVKIKEEAKKALEDLPKLLKDLAKELAGIGVNEGDSIRQKAELQLKELATMREKIKAAGELNSENKKLLDQAKQLASQIEEKQLGQLRLKNLREIQNKNQEIALDIKKVTGTQIDYIDAETQMLIEQLLVKSKSLELDGAGTAAIQEQIALIKQRAEEEKKKAPDAAFQNTEKAGMAIANQISGVLTKGAGAVLGGAISGANAILDASQALLSAIPDVLNKTADVLNMLTDLPNVLLEAVTNVVSAMIRFVAEFIPNILKAIPQILTELVTGLLIELPNAFIAMMQALPDLLIGMLDQLPSIVESFVTNLITFLPKIAISLITFLVEGAPRIALEILKVLVVGIPKAIIRGIVEGARQILRMFTSGLPKIKIPVDGASLTKGIKAFGRNLTKEASKVFAVTDLTDTMKKVDPAKETMKAMQDAAEAVKSLWQQLIDGLIAVWRWIWEKIIQPLLDGLKAVWGFIWKNILLPIIDGIRMVWQWAYDNIIVPFIDGVSTVFRWVMDNVVNPLLDGLSSVFGWVVDNVVSPLIDGVMTAFNWVAEKVVVPLQKVGAAIAAPITKAFEGISSFFNNLFSGLGKLFDFDFEGFKDSMGAAFKDVVEFAFLPLKTMMNFFIDVLNGLKIPKVDVSGKVLGKKFSFNLLPAIDLIPGEIQHFAAGGFVPNGTDTVPAMLTPGEFVLNKGAVSSLGASAVASLNKGQLPNGDTTITMNLTVNTTEPVTDSYVRTRLMPKIKDELKRASLDGAFIVAASGVRTT